MIKIAQEKLMKLVYLDLKSETRLETYADTIVLEKEGGTNYIAAIRFGGYPESIKGMSEAIYGGGTITVEVNGNFLTAYSHIKQYRKELSHYGIYAEATLLIQDEEQSSDDNASNYSRPRKCYLFCEHNNPDRLFEELDKKTSVRNVCGFIRKVEEGDMFFTPCFTRYNQQVDYPAKYSSRGIL